ncbi:hypothetical protein CF651_23510 [Paenibacillus rigui]|uniref:Uncharacterized protein n=1 Tax=Paenibacillus rigui TaxID=554312 RepID=A0A229UKG3_9BACL|nr:hypothetical protein CF651_23510 [Paenibacillus rigui]
MRDEFKQAIGNFFWPFIYPGGYINIRLLSIITDNILEMLEPYGYGMELTIFAIGFPGSCCADHSDRLKNLDLNIMLGSALLRISLTASKHPIYKWRLCP